jgi:hypothetical protein
MGNPHPTMDKRVPSADAAMYRHCAVVAPSRNTHAESATVATTCPADAISPPTLSVPPWGTVVILTPLKELGGLSLGSANPQSDWPRAWVAPFPTTIERPVPWGGWEDCPTAVTMAVAIASRTTMGDFMDAGRGC